MTYESNNDAKNEDHQNWLVMTSQWPDNCDANTWQVISNSLDIDFIHGDIHGRLCKKQL